MQEPGSIAAVAKEVLVFDASVGIGEHAPLWPEDEADAFASCDDVESCEEGAVGQGSDMLGSGHCLAEDIALRDGLVGCAIKEHDDGQCGGYPAGV